MGFEAGSGAMARWLFDEIFCFLGDLAFLTVSFDMGPAGFSSFNRELKIEKSRITDCVLELAQH